VARLDQIDKDLATEDQRLAELENGRRADLTRLEDARERRASALAALQAQSRTRAEALQRLQHEQSGLESLLRELRRAIEKYPIDGNDAFSHLRGKLAWPVAGQLAARFGQTRAGAVKWDGVLIDAERGAQVRAVYQGRIIFADWLPGLGLLTIVDHGDGYLSLYGHNERLYKAAGERVAAGEAIAAAGDSGGSPRPALYFEIRKAGHPVDPLPWFKAADPGSSAPP
jgi:murein hydrolase activator